MGRCVGVPVHDFEFCLNDRILFEILLKKIEFSAELYFYNRVGVLVYICLWF
jgi:hypothetical protein